jgi:AraC-like DNA-binding protein
MGERVRNDRLSANGWLRAMGRPDVAVTLPLGGYVRVAREWGTPARALAEQLIYFVTDGVFAGKVGGNDVMVGPGTFLWVMPGVPNQLWIPPGHEPFTVFFFRLRARQKTRNLRIHPDFVLLHDAWELQPVIREITDELRMPGEFGEQRVRGLLTALFASVLRRLSAPTGGHRALSRAQRLRVMDHARRHVTDRLTPAQLAADLQLSEDYFTRLFRASFGLAPRTWLVRDRIRMAADQLADTSLSIKRVARLFGYESTYLFSRQFKQVMGVTARDYRRNLLPPSG